MAEPTAPVTKEDFKYASFNLANCPNALPEYREKWQATVDAWEAQPKPADEVV